MRTGRRRFGKKRGRSTSRSRPLAELADVSGEHDAAIRYRLRILERDPYDESAHLGIVTALLAASRHGGARRRYGDYAARMDEIGVEAAPFPSAPRASEPGAGGQAVTLG